MVLAVQSPGNGSDDSFYHSFTFFLHSPQLLYPNTTTGSPCPLRPRVEKRGLKGMGRRSARHYTDFLPVVSWRGGSPACFATQK